MRSRADQRTVSLSVSESDERRGKFPLMVVEALVRAGAVARSIEPTDAPEDLLDAAFEQIERHGDGWVIVLDDVHHLRSPATLRSLAHIVERSPATLDVILSARADPPIGLTRPMLEGRLTQIRHADLVFNEAETSELVAAHGVGLEPGDVEILWQRTGGWAAGLRLAANALQEETEPHQFVLSTAAAEAAVTEYLLAEVLSRQDDATQQLLLRTSIVDCIAPGLAVALTRNPQAGDVLDDLVRQGLFVTEFGSDQCYQYHPMFRAILRAELRQRDPGLVTELHRCAASWYLTNGMPAEGELHARAAADWPLVGRLVLARWLDALTSSDPSVIDDPLAGLSTEVVLATPELTLLAAIEACRWAKRNEADQYRSVLDEIDPPPPPGNGPTPPSQLEQARTFLDLTYGWTFGVDERSRLAIAELRERRPSDVAGSRLRQLAALTEIEADIDAGDFARALEALDELTGTGGTSPCQLTASAIHALLEATSGAVSTAEARLHTVLADVEEHPLQPAFQIARLAMALCGAQGGGQRGIGHELTEDGTPTEWSSRAFRAADRVVRATARGKPPFFVSCDASTAQQPLGERALLALGVLQVVDTEGRSITIGGHGERLVVEARQRLSDGTIDQALDRLADWLDHAASRHMRTVIEANILAAIAAHHLHDTDAECRFVRDAVDISMATGILAPIFTYRAHIGDILDRNPGNLGNSDAALFDLVDRLQYSNGLEIVEPLTAREIEVLQHLPTLMSNTEIARQMRLSVNTVKTHLKAVYRKLGVAGRRDAVLRGRELELL